MTQTERVLAALAANPDRGITQVDFSLPNVIDGGPPITRVAARIGELREDGHNVISDGHREKCRVYKLIPAAVSPGAPPTGPNTSSGPGGPNQGGAPDETRQLFDTTDQEFDSIVPPLSPYDTDIAA